MHFSHDPVDTDSKSTNAFSSFTQSLFELPQCRDCKKLFAGFFGPSHDTSDAWSSMTGQRSEFDHMTKETPESCLLCFCIRHLLPADLPQSTEIKAILTPGRSLDCLELEVVEGRSRALGKVQIEQLVEGDVLQTQNHEMVPTTDFNVISRLLRECEENHVHRKWNLERYQSPTNVQLIDVEDMMIISATTERRYLALSYVWGGDNSFATTTQTRATVAEKRGLTKYLSEIPRTIKDAMEVARKLGERYLWVDRLCIVQDDAAQTKAHIEKMDIIYSHALITIIAREGVAATSPLPGVRPGTKLGLPTTRVGKISMSVRPSHVFETDVPHERRGWTLQEQLMSKRCLYFNYHTTWFQCDEGISAKDEIQENHPSQLLQLPASDSLNMHFFRPILMDETEDRRLDRIWKTYAKTIERYRRRELTYDEDAVPAIQGIAKVISSLLDVPLVSAVPLSMLPRALRFYLWDHLNKSGRNEMAPSWSWAGWKDSIYFDDQGLTKRVHYEAVESELKVKYRAYNPHKPPVRGALQPTHSQLISSGGNSNLQMPLYTILDVECYSTRASSFKLSPHAKMRIKRLNIPVFYGPVCHVLDQWGNSCGQCFGRKPEVSASNRLADKLQWILISRSHPIQFTDPYYFEFSSTQDAPWSTRDIMLVKWSEARGFWERVYIAHVDKGAWEAAGPTVTQLLLG